jgi:hypothetical protein
MDPDMVPISSPPSCPLLFFGTAAQQRLTEHRTMSLSRLQGFGFVQEWGVPNKSPLNEENLMIRASGFRGFPWFSHNVQKPF